MEKKLYDQKKHVGNINPANSDIELWDTHELCAHLYNHVTEASLKATERAINESGAFPKSLSLDQVSDLESGDPKKTVLDNLVSEAKRKRSRVFFLQFYESKSGSMVFMNDGRHGRKWIWLTKSLTPEYLSHIFRLILKNVDKNILFIPSGKIVTDCRNLCRKRSSTVILGENNLSAHVAIEIYHHTSQEILLYNSKKSTYSATSFSHLDHLEAESIHIMREVVAESENPVMLYSVGKDSAVMLHIAQKAFYPSVPPFPLLHVDTRWKFKAMYQFRDYMAKKSGMKLLVHINPEGAAQNINPFDHGSQIHTDIMKTQALKQALDKHKFDVAFGGARRDEEKSRAKERIFSFRTSSHQWDPKNQRPELWNLYNTFKRSGESIRVFPLSNWTELDIWQYIYRENIPIVPLYYAADRPVVERDGMLLMVDDDRVNLYPSEKIQIKKIRFRTLGCYPLTGAIDSEADTLDKVVLEILNANTSERQGRIIDNDVSGSMEKKKKEGYF